jgi:monofunctional biosynthetic peptidoglycan transglycosylase
MARKRQPDRARARPAAEPRPRPLRRLARWLVRALGLAVLALVALVALLAVVTPPRGPYMRLESARLGGIQQDWVPIEAVSPHLPRALVAAEDANFCRHWGFDMAAIRTVIAEGETRGASTIPQQTVKNLFLWQGRSWPRKAAEAALTPLVELLWSKRRILEVYLNIAEFDTGVFGAEAAARHYYGIPAAALSLDQAARLAAVLPDPKDRAPDDDTAFMRARAAAIADGAETIRRDGRAACFED